MRLKNLSHTRQRTEKKNEKTKNSQTGKKKHKPPLSLSRLFSSFYFCTTTAFASPASSIVAASSSSFFGGNPIEESE